MSKKIALFCALIGVVAFLAVPAYAEVQNIKISGDIQALAIYRNNYDMETAGWMQPQETGLATEIKNVDTEDQDSLFASIVRLRVDADLTDNVAACVSLANLREWDVEGDAASFDIVLDLAYVTLKEMLYSPLTLIVGRQELVVGDGLIMGNGRFNDPDNHFLYDDISPLHGGDGIRAILDFDPWAIDVIIAKIQEQDNNAQADNAAADTGAGVMSDEDVYGVNLGYKFASYDAEVEGYFFTKQDNSWDQRIDTVDANGAITYSRMYEENDVYLIGLRGSLVPIENLTLGGEIAGQFGEIRDDGDYTSVAGADPTTSTLDVGGDTSLDLHRDREALAANVAAAYTFADLAWIPQVGVEYLYLSGEEPGQSGDYETWDPMYRGKRMSTIRDMMENVAGFDTLDNLDTSAWTNQHTIKASGSLDLGTLIDGLSLDLAYLHFWFDEDPLPGANDEVGDEIDFKITYDYTEDVQFAIDSAWFIPGDYYDRVAQGAGLAGLRGGGLTAGTQPTNRVANDMTTSIIGSCKVSF